MTNRIPYHKKLTSAPLLLEIAPLIRDAGSIEAGVRIEMPLSSEDGYEGDCIANVLAGNEFETDGKWSDITRFPARIKAAATCLKERKLFGKYRLSYKNGILSIECIQRQAVSRNMDWIREELALALELYLKHRQSIPGKKSEEVLALSATLRNLNQTRGKKGDETLRNANGVYLKLMNFRSNDPIFTVQGKRGMTHANALEKVLWDEFSNRPTELFKYCDSIREAIVELRDASDVENDEGAEAKEGKILTRLHRYRERDSEIVRKKKNSVMKSGKKLLCEVCGFDFQVHYGERGAAFIECHHTKPVCEMGDGAKTRLEDLALVCPNCHRMIHRRAPWLSIFELRAIFKA